MARMTRAGSARPTSSGFELAVWYLMRVTALALFVLVLAHFTIVHFIYDPAIQKADWIAARWSGAGWRTVDALMLAAVVFHAFMGMRTVVGDYTRGTTRVVLVMVLYLLAFLIFAMGTMALITFPDAAQVPS
jgi:succinate dehydrogenase hydrophobic anchor subunit